MTSTTPVRVANGPTTLSGNEPQSSERITNLFKAREYRAPASTGVGLPSFTANLACRHFHSE